MTEIFNDDCFLEKIDLSNMFFTVFLQWLFRTRREVVCKLSAIERYDQRRSPGREMT